MDINPNNFLAINEILSDVLVHIDDEPNSKLTPGYCRAQVKMGLDALGFEMPFIEVTNDYPIPSDLKLDMPSGCYNLNSINIYAGTPDAVGYTENVYWRKGVHTRGANTGVTANVNQYNVTDPFCRVALGYQAKYYFSVQNGILILSDDCSNFDYARLTYNGIPSGSLDEVKMIPPEAREALILYAVEKCAASLKLRDNKYRIVQLDAASQLDRYGLNGAWHNTKMLLLKLDRKKLHDVILYNSKLNY
jgi:hypothetical protein